MSEQENIVRHTPGPWYVEKLLHIQCVTAEPGNMFQQIVPLVNHQENDGHPYGSITSQNKTQDEIDANARLIAAAPELLEVAKAIVNAAFYTEMVDCIDLAEKAINKTEGTNQED